MIGIIGGYGDVGTVVLQSLCADQPMPLRIGGRNPQKASTQLREQFPDAEWVQVDTQDHDSLTQFMKGCRLVINCTGPSCRTAANVARCAIECGCHYVDAGMNTELTEMQDTPQNVTVLYGTGSMPGLTGIMPRMFSRQLDRMTSLKLYYGALGRFTAAAAEDYLDGICSSKNRARMAWEKGRPVPFNNASNADFLPLFRGVPVLYPFLDEEAEYVAQDLKLEHGEWYMAQEGTHLAKLVTRAGSLFLQDPKAAVEQLCLASRLDSEGLEEYINLIFEFSGEKDGKPSVHTLLMQMDRPAKLTGLIVAAAAKSILDGRAPLGVLPLYKLPDLTGIEACLRDHADNFSWIQLMDCEISALSQEEDGEL